MIIWDEPKRLANLDKHGMDFAYLSIEFFERALVVASHSKRFIAIGRLVNGVVVVIFAKLGTEGLSVISMRPAKKKERKMIDG